VRPRNVRHRTAQVSTGARSARTAGIVYALLAYASWGLLPVYWKALRSVPVAEVLAHRVLWCSLFAALLVSVAREWPAVRRALRTRRVAVALLATSALIGLNWLLFIYTVSRGDVLAASLGYFLNPLVNVALGRAVLGERLRPVQAAAVAIAAAGVLELALFAGGLPWISLALAASFGLYGLLRKVAPLSPLVSLVVETASLAPVALGYLAFLGRTDLAAAPASAAGVKALLALSGVVTALPLVWFVSAAVRLRLTTLGLFQYLAPSGQFLLAVAAYGEPFAPAQALAFGCIWTGLLLYSADALRMARARPAD
jgi:chloramphenicol-sensitive protein RarD